MEISPQGSSFPHLDLAFVFFVHSISFYLKDNGVNSDNISNNYIFECILSNHITPFQLFETSKAFLPIKKVKSWTKLSLPDLASINQSTTQFLNLLKDESGSNYSGLYDALNRYGKLEKQKFEVGDWVVLYGAGGMNICATAIEITSDDKPPIIDQTLYWKVCITKEEASTMSSNYTT